MYYILSGKVPALLEITLYVVLGQISVSLLRHVVRVVQSEPALCTVKNVSTWALQLQHGIDSPQL